MNRTEVVSAVAQQAGVTQSDADKVLKAFAAVLADAIERKEKVTLPGFMSAEATHRNARVGRNPQTGEEIQVAATWAVKLTPGSALKDAAKRAN